MVMAGVFLEGGYEGEDGITFSDFLMSVYCILWL